MNTVPNMISTKDLSYLSDIFEWNFNASKMVNHFVGEVQNEAIKESLLRARAMHTAHCHQIAQLLGGTYE